MLHTFQDFGNGTLTENVELLYNSRIVNAFVRFSQARIPVYSRAVGLTLLVAGLNKDFETDLTINEIASNSGVSRSMTIQSLRLLVDLQIFHKQEEINKPCTYKFNFEPWLEYSTPEPKKKVVPFCGQDAEAKTVEDTCSVPDTPQEVSINAYPEPMSEGDVSPKYQPHPSFANDPMFNQVAHAARMEEVLSRPASPIRSNDGGDKSWGMPNNPDMESGYVVAKIMEEEKINVTVAVAHIVKLAKEVIKIFADFKIPFRITDSPVDACKKLLAAITKPSASVTKPQAPTKPKESNVTPIQQKRLQEETWFREACSVKGWGLSYRDLSDDGRKYISPDGITILHIGDLMLKYPDPSSMPSLTEIVQSLQAV